MARVLVGALNYAMVPTTNETPNNDLLEDSMSALSVTLRAQGDGVVQKRFWAGMFEAKPRWQVTTQSIVGAKEAGNAPSLIPAGVSG